MPRTLIVPGVSVEARFDVAPPLPARSGILGAVGVVDRDPGTGPRGVTTAVELLELFGPATRYAFPEAVSALTNGISEVVVSPVASASGRAASVTLRDDEDDAVAILRARAVGPWGNKLAVKVTRTMAADGSTVRRLGIEVLYDGVVIERHDNLILRPGDDNDLFEVINRKSGVLVALDAVFQADLPQIDATPAALVDSGARVATGALSRNGGALISLAAATPGAAGNRISVAVADGHAARVFRNGTNDVLRVVARAAGAAGSNIDLRFEDDGAGGVNATVRNGGGTGRSYNGLTNLTELVAALNTDVDVRAVALGDQTPTTATTRVSLEPTVSLTLRIEGVRTASFEDLASAAEIATRLTEDGAVVPTVSGDPTHRPDAGAVNQRFLSGGRDAGPARAYRSESSGDDAVLELVPTPAADAAALRLQVRRGSQPDTVALDIGRATSAGGVEITERHDNLSMDPDSLRFLPAVLRSESSLLRAIDMARREHAQSFPAGTASGLRLTGGDAPALAAWEAAIGALAGEEAVDLVLAGLQNWADDDLDHLAIQQALLGHSLAQADAARPRIALGSIPPSSGSDVSAITDHASQVSDRRFVLVSPPGAEGALAGLLGRLNYFESPTFKTVASPGVPLVAYSDSQLDKLVGPGANVCVIQRKRGRGTICLKGINTKGEQISVTRVADRCIREVRAIADKFIGELNNATQRNALKQMIISTFTAMERDGALVPSVDGESPAFLVDVYGSQEDTAAGIVRIDIAVRPVRAIDYIYATIRVRN